MENDAVVANLMRHIQTQMGGKKVRLVYVDAMGRDCFPCWRGFDLRRPVPLWKRVLTLIASFGLDQARGEALVRVNLYEMNRNAGGIVVHVRDEDLPVVSQAVKSWPAVDGFRNVRLKELVFEDE